MSYVRQNSIGSQYLEADPLILSVGERCAVNLPYVKDLMLLRPELIVEIYDPIRYPNEYFTDQVSRIEVQSGDITIGTRMLFSPKTCAFSEKQTFGVEGDSYEREITFELPKNAKMTLDYLYRFRRQKWVVVFQDFNDNMFICGSKHNPMRLLAQKNISEKNHIIVSITGTSSKPVWMIGGSELRELILQEYNYDYNFDFTS